MKIRTKFIIIFLTLALAPMLLIGVLNFIDTKNALEEQALESLNNIAEGKEAQILEFLSAKKERTRDFASDGFIKDSLQALSESGSSVEKEKIVEDLNRHLNTNKKPLDKDVLDVHVLNLEGVIVSATRADEIGQDESGEGYFQKSLSEAYVDDARRHEGHREEVFIATGAPIKSRTGNKTIGVLMNSYSLKNIEDFISGQRARDLGAPTTIENKGTRDIFIINQDGIMITPSKKMADFENLEHDMKMHIAVQACSSAQEINREWKDSMGASVYGASMCPQVEQDWRWAIIVEQDKDEILIPVKELRNSSMVVGVIVLLMAVFFAFFIAKSMSNPIVKLTKIADDISRGKMNVKIEEINSRDEIGDLARAFGRTIVSLKLAMRKQSKPKNSEFITDSKEGKSLEGDANKIV